MENLLYKASLFFIKYSFPRILAGHCLISFEYSIFLVGHLGLSIYKVFNFFQELEPRILESCENLKELLLENDKGEFNKLSCLKNL